MKRAVIAVMASLMAMMTVSAEQFADSLLSGQQETEFPDGTIRYGVFDPQTPLPVGTVVRNQREPWNRLTLENNVLAVVTSVTLDSGTWLLYGGTTVQDTGYDGVNPERHYLYTEAAFAQDPSYIPIKGHTGLDARHYAKYWWFACSPVTHSIRINSGFLPVYSLVKSYGQVPPLLSQAFGSIGALKVAQ